MDTARVSGNGKSTGYLQDMVTPVREHLADTARELTRVLAKAGDAVKQIRVADVAEFMRRSPLAGPGRGRRHRPHGGYRAVVSREIESCCFATSGERVRRRGAAF